MCTSDLRKDRKSNWGAWFDCGTSIVDPCIALLNSHSAHTRTNTRLIDQIDLHMSDRAHFSPFPPLTNLWPLIYTRVNLYTLITLSCSLFSHKHTHKAVVFTTHCTDTCSCCLSTCGKKKHKNVLKESRRVCHCMAFFCVGSMMSCHFQDLIMLT